MFKITTREWLLKLPTDLWISKIFQYLDANTLNRLALVSKLSYTVARNEIFWHNKYQNQYPLRKFLINSSNHWYSQFVQRTLLEYRGLPPVIIKLFLIAKEGFTEYFEKLFPRIHLSNLLDQVDCNDLSPIEWIQKNKHQPLLNHIFKLVLFAYQEKARNPKVKYYTNEQCGWSPVHWAILCNQSEEVIFRYIGDQDFSQAGMTPLHVAAQYGMHKHLPLLLEKYNVNQRTNYFDLPANGFKLKKTALHLAAAKGHVQTVKILIEAKNILLNLTILEEDVLTNIVNRKTTALHCAVSRNHIEVTSLLADLISPYLMDDQYESALSQSINNNNRSIFNILIQFKPRSKKELKSLNLTLFNVVSKGLYEYVKPLIELGANPHWVNSRDTSLLDGRTAFNLAIEQQHKQTVLAFLAKEKNPKQNYYPRSQSFNRFAALIGVLVGLCIGVGVVIGVDKKIKFSNKIVSVVLAIVIVVVVAVLCGIAGWFVANLIFNIKNQQGLEFIRKTSLSDFISDNSHVDIEEGGIRPISKPSSEFLQNYKLHGFLSSSEPRSSVVQSDHSQELGHFLGL